MRFWNRLENNGNSYLFTLSNWNPVSLGSSLIKEAMVKPFESLFEMKENELCFFTEFLPTSPSHFCFSCSKWIENKAQSVLKNFLLKTEFGIWNSRICHFNSLMSPNRILGQKKWNFSMFCYFSQFSRKNLPEKLWTNF